MWPISCVISYRTPHTLSGTAAMRQAKPFRIQSGGSGCYVWARKCIVVPMKSLYDHDLNIWSVFAICRRLPNGFGKQRKFWIVIWIGIMYSSNKTVISTKHLMQSVPCKLPVGMSDLAASCAPLARLQYLQKRGYYRIHTWITFQLVLRHNKLPMQICRYHFHIGLCIRESSIKNNDRAIVWHGLPNCNWSTTILIQRTNIIWQWCSSQFKKYRNHCAFQNLGIQSLALQIYLILECNFPFGSVDNCELVSQCGTHSV